MILQKKNTTKIFYIIQRPDGTYYCSPTNDAAFIEDVTPILKRNLSDINTWDFVGSSTGERYITLCTDEQLLQMARDLFLNSEIITWVDRAGNTHRDTNVKGLSSADPVMSSALEIVAGAPVYNKVFKIGKSLAGNLVKDFARDFGYTKLGNWTRNKILSNLLNKNIKILDKIGGFYPEFTEKALNIKPKNGNGGYLFDEPTYQIYTGPTHDISEIIDTSGNVKLKNLLNIQNEALKNVPNGTIARHRLENLKWYPTDWNTFLHTQDVYKRALQYGYPEEALFPTLMHDAGKLWTENGHGPYGASIVRQIFPRASEDQIQAIYGHMLDNPTNQLTRLVKGVDIKETNPFRTWWIMLKLLNSGIKGLFNVTPYVDDVYLLNPIKGSMFDNYNNYIYKLLNRNPEYGDIYIKEGKKLTTAGLFNPTTESSLIFYNDPDPLNTAVHEAISHKTDNLVENELTSKFIPKTDINYVNVPTSTYYTDLADINGKGWFRDHTYEDWREMRATLNELRSMRRNIDDVSDSKLLLDIDGVNGYGLKYFQLLRQLDKSSIKKWLSKFRTAYKYLPVSIPTMQTLNKDDSHEKEK